MFIHNTRHNMMPFGKTHIFPGDNKLSPKQVAALKPYEAGLKSAIAAGWLTVNETPVENLREDTSADQVATLFGAPEKVAETVTPVEDTEVDANAPTTVTTFTGSAPAMGDSLAEMLRKRNEEG